MVQGSTHRPAPPPTLRVYPTRSSSIRPRSRPVLVETANCCQNLAAPSLFFLRFLLRTFPSPLYCTVVLSSYLVSVATTSSSRPLQLTWRRRPLERGPAAAVSLVSAFSSRSCLRKRFVLTRLDRRPGLAREAPEASDAKPHRQRRKPRPYGDSRTRDPRGRDTRRELQVLST